MSKTLSFRGKLDMGLQNRIKLATLNGKTGYRITKFQTMSTTPGTAAGTGIELICQIFKTDQTGAITSTVDFTEGNLLAVTYLKDGVAASDAGKETIIFDQEVFNQDIYISMTDASGNTIPGNYYIELETVKLTDVQSTQLTLKNLRNIASR
tara:strand:+ start:38 stop:493 length:456 start_codon:yes stop_codon:yes gene_type:complete